MFMFLNLDCVLAVPADALGPRGNGTIGLRRLERLLGASPECSVIITGDRRYRMTLQHFRGFFSPAFRQRLIATTLIYPSEARGRMTRLNEVNDWLVHTSSSAEDWLALDNCPDDYARAPHRLVYCETLTEKVASVLGAALLHRSDRAEIDIAPVSALLAAPANGAVLHVR